MVVYNPKTERVEYLSPPATSEALADLAAALRLLLEHQQFEVARALVDIMFQVASPVMRVVPLEQSDELVDGKVKTK